MADKKELAARVLELVGGADNVVMATHCITRLRFNLKDDSKADLEALKTLDGALGAQVKDGQWQVIIGASVGSVYDELEPMLGDRMGGEVSADAEQPELQKGSARVFDIITGIFSAIIPALVAGGIVKGILAAIAAFGIDTGAGDFAIFNMISDIPFYFLPFLLAMSTADKFRVNRSLALCVAGSLMYPTIVNAVGTGETPLALFGFAVPIFSYADSVFPVIFGVIGLSFVYRAIDKVVPDLFKLVVVPALSLAIVISRQPVCARSDWCLVRSWSCQRYRLAILDVRPRCRFSAGLLYAAYRALRHASVNEPYPDFQYRNAWV